MSALSGRTYFYHEDGRRLGDVDEIVPITLYKSMIITIHGYEETFEVVDWNYHHGHSDEEHGLRIILRTSAKGSTWTFTNFPR